MRGRLLGDTSPAVSREVIFLICLAFFMSSAKGFPSKEGIIIAPATCKICASEIISQSMSSLPNLPFAPM